MVSQDTLDQDIRHERLYNANLKKAYALSMVEDVSTYQQIRSAMSVGHFDECKELLDQETEHDKDYYLEMARYHTLRSEWQQAVDFALQGLKLKVDTSYHLTLLQVSSIALYELGKLPECLQHIRKIEALLMLHDAPTIKIYNQLLKIKVQFLQDRESGASNLSQAFDLLLSENLLNLDTLLAWFRCKIDLLRISQIPHANYTKAALSIAEALGDNLYIVLAKIDHQIACGIKPSNNSSSNYEREKNLLADINSDESSVSTTATIMRNYLNTSLSDQRERNHQLEKVDVVVVADLNLAIKLDPFSYEFHPPRDKSFEALKILTRGDIHKEQFFSLLWKQTYADHLHNNLIRTLVCRLRKTFGVTITSRKGVLSLKQAIVI